MIYPGAQWRGPIPQSNYSAGSYPEPVGAVIHHMDTSLAVCDMLFRAPGYQRSAHYGTGRDGTVFCWVDPANVAYHACAANWPPGRYIGIENDDQGQDLTLSDAQIVSIRGILAFHNVAPRLVENMGEPGVGYHGQTRLPCASGWGQTACCGSMIDQLPLLIAGTPPAPAPPPILLEDEVKILRTPADPAPQSFYVWGGDGPPVHIASVDQLNALRSMQLTEHELLQVEIDRIIGVYPPVVAGTEKPASFTVKSTVTSVIE